MTIQEIISLLEAKLINLKTLYNLASSSGNLDEISSLEEKILETEHTVLRLKELQ